MSEEHMNTKYKGERGKKNLEKVKGAEKKINRASSSVQRQKDLKCVMPWWRGVYAMFTGYT